MAHKFKIVSGAGGQFRTQFVYNKEVMVWSENYKSKSSAQNCIQLHQEERSVAPIVDLSKDGEAKGYRFEIAKSKDGQFFLRFVAANGETMVRSETYTAKANARKCAMSVQKNGPGAPTVDES